MNIRKVPVDPKYRIEIELSETEVEHLIWDISRLQSLPLGSYLQHFYDMLRVDKGKP